MPEEVPVLESAHRHGVSDADIRHAYRNGIAAFRLDDSSEMVIGPDYSGRFLEVGVGYSDYDGAEVIFHAMPARDEYLRRLP